MPVEEGRLPTNLQSAFDFYLDKPTNQLQPEQANFRWQGPEADLQGGLVPAELFGLV